MSREVVIETAESWAAKQAALKRASMAWEAMKAIAPTVLPMCVDMQPGLDGKPRRNIDKMMLADVSLQIALEMVDVYLKSPEGAAS